MGDWFDLNNDGKLDPFEEACKWSYINNSIEYLKKEEEKKTNASTYNTYNNPVNNANNNPADNTNDTPVDMAAYSNSWKFRTENRPLTLPALIFIVVASLIYIAFIINLIFWWLSQK